MSREVEAPTQVVLKLEEGSFTIPPELQQELGLEPDGMVQVILDKGELRIRPASILNVSTNSPALRALYDYFAPVREGIIAAGYSEEEVDADIDAAVRVVREQYG